MKQKPNPYHLDAVAITTAILLLAGRSDMGAPLWQTILGLLACGMAALYAWLRYQRDVADKRHREQLRRRNGREANDLTGSKLG